MNVKGEPPSTFTLTRGLSYIASILFTLVKFTCVQVYVRTYKLRDSGNPSVYSHARLKAMLNETICSEIFRATMLVQQLNAMWKRCVSLKIYVANCSL